MQAIINKLRRGHHVGMGNPGTDNKTLGSVSKFVKATDAGQVQQLDATVLAVAGHLEQKVGAASDWTELGIRR
jgi:hypothetical protein